MAKKKTPEAIRELFRKPAALEFFREQGRIGGKKGSKARMKKLSAKQRSEIAKNAVQAREAKRKKKSPAG